MGRTLRPFLWTHVATTVARFVGTTEVDLPVTCTYDFEVAGAKYLHALEDGEIPLVLLFSGTVFVRATPAFRGRRWRGTRRPVPPARGDVARRHGLLLPQQRLDSRAAVTRSTRCSGSRSGAPCTTWDETFERLLKEAGEDT